MGWIASQTLQEVDPKAQGRQDSAPTEDSNPRTWASKKKARTCCCCCYPSRVLLVLLSVLLLLSSLLYRLSCLLLFTVGVVVIFVCCCILLIDCMFRGLRVAVFRLFATLSYAVATRVSLRKLRTVFTTGPSFDEMVESMLTSNPSSRPPRSSVG